MAEIHSLEAARQRRQQHVDEASVPVWGSPAPVDVDAGALRAGEDETAPEPGFTELVVPAAALVERVPVPDAEDRILPAWLTDREVARQAAARQARYAGRAAARVAVQSPRATGRVAWWTVRGAVKGSARWARWVSDLDGHPLVGTVTAESDRAYTVMADRRTRRQKTRWALTGGALVVVLAAWAVAAVWVPWVPWLAGAVVVALLARHGRPEGVKLVAPNPTVAYRPRLTHQGVVAALSALGIPVLSKALQADSTRIWRSDFTPVRGGHRIELQLPGSVLSADLVQHEQRLASALARPQDTVIVEPLPHRTPSDLRLWIFDKPVLSGSRGPGPLATARKASWWDPVEVGITRNAQPHRERLAGGAWFVGGRPNYGKSTTGQLAAAQTALDARALLVIANLKGSPDYGWARPVAHRYINGSPDTDRTVIPATVALISWLLGEQGRRNDFLSRLVERGKADSNDVTPELAAKYDELRPMTVILDEVHRLFDPTDNPQADQAVEELAKLLKACRSSAMTIICITQLAGTESIPVALTRAARLRGCMSVLDEISWRQIFGNAGKGSYQEAGAATLAPGTIILRTEDGMPAKVGCWHLQRHHLAEIGKRALAVRSDLELLTGEAAGQAVPAGEVSDPAQLLREVLAAIPSAAPTGGPDDAGVAWLSGLEQVLGQGDSETADRADGWLSGELRARGVPVRKVNRRWVDEQGAGQQRTAAAVRADAVRTALARLTLGEG